MSTLSTFPSFSELSTEIRQMIWSQALQGRLIRLKPIWKCFSRTQQLVTVLVIAEPIPILQVCRESRAVALRYYTEVECEQASLSFVEDDQDRDIKRFQDLKSTSATSTYINWLNDIIFLECDNCQFAEVKDVLANDIRGARYLLLDTDYSRGNPEICSELKAAFDALRQLFWVTPPSGLESWDLTGPLILEVPTSKSDDFVTMFTQISNIRPSKGKSPEGDVVVEVNVDTPRDIRYWPLMPCNR
jgi:hypothetical protein